MLKSTLVRPRSWLQGVAPGEWLLLFLGELLLQRYAWLLDDAYVYFRYVDNLVLLGRGLVYNPGEFVEGFSSPAWCMLLVLLRSTGCPYWLGIRILGAVIFLLVWAMLVSLNRRLIPLESRDNTVNYPLISIALTYGSSCYFTSGVEGPLVILVGVAFAFLVISPQSPLLQLLVGLGPLIRPELAVPWVLLVVYLWITEREMPRALVLSGILSSSAWMIFRIVYYADFLPNTFYLKSIHWYSQGLRYLYDTMLPYQLLPLAVFFILIGSLSLKTARSRLFLLFLCLPVVIFVIRIGGDVRHFRYLLFPFVVLSCATAGLLEVLLSRWEGGRRRTRVVAVFAIFALFTISGFSRQLRSHPLLKPRIHAKSAEYRIHLRIHDAAIHRSKYTPKYRSTGREDEFFEAKKQASLDPSNMPVVVTPICRVAYHNWGSRIIHSYGLTDSILARVDVPSIRPGHKEGLKPLAEDLAGIEQRYPDSPDPIRQALEAGCARKWMVENRRALLLLEKKRHNRHRFFENLKLALSRIPPIELPERSEKENEADVR